MTRTKYKVAQLQQKNLPKRHRNWDILDKEDCLTLFKDKDELKDCREYYRDGVGTRNLDKLIKNNWFLGSDMEVLGFSTDHQGKVLRIFANKYPDPDGDDVCESIHWESITIGQPSKYKYCNTEFYYS
tara:strand:- start:7 stop:390 length:384 start_codon:yes stop_codon:yes gene_type:complete